MTITRTDIEKLARFLHDRKYPAIKWEDSTRPYREELKDDALRILQHMEGPG